MPKFRPEIRRCKVCASTFETTTSTQVYCTPRCREVRGGFGIDTRSRLSSTQRGYGPAHRKARAKWKARIAQDGGTQCCICGYWVDPDEQWHLDHTEDRTGYRGVAHARCNIRDGAKRGRTKQDEPARPSSFTSLRQWGQAPGA